MKALNVKLVIFLIIPPLFLLVVDSFPITRSFEGICTRVLDGDTVIVAGEKIRLAHIDAPESSQLSFEGRAIGKQSSNFLSKLVLGKKVRVEYSGRGRYGRLLGLIFLKSEINELMIRSGMAIAYGNGGVKYHSLEYEARLLRKGIFGTIGFDSPKYYRKRNRYAAK